MKDARDFVLTVVPTSTKRNAPVHRSKKRKSPRPTPSQFLKTCPSTIKRRGQSLFFLTRGNRIYFPWSERIAFITLKKENGSLKHPSFYDQDVV